MTAKLKAGVIGYGSMGKNHARVLSSLPGVELVGIVDPQVSKERDDILNSVEEIIAKRPDYCVIATPTIYHEEVAMKLAEAKTHLLIEKPCTPSVASATRLRDEFERLGVLAFVGYIERCNPAVVEGKKRIEEGQLGDIYQVATTRVGPFPGRISDVGVIKDLATHDIDLTQWVTNSSYRDLAAITSMRSGRENEDIVLAVGRLESETLVQHTVGWLSPVKQRLHNFTGELGMLSIDTLMGDLTFCENGSVESGWDEVRRFRGVREGNITRYSIEKKEPLLLEHERFRDVILGKDAQMVTLDSAISILDIAEKLSSQKKLWLSLEEKS
jgi:predicted dehydrogenase